jgi:site-specific DNA-methyltransferase (adenine-specific)
MQENKIDYPFIDINELKPYENNARLHPQEQINKIVNSIKEFGFITPVIIDENNTILVGHGRTQAAKAAGLTKVPYRRITNLTDEQKRAYILADNKLSDIAEWDEDILQMELESISLDMTAFGFDDFTIDIGEDTEAEVVEDEIPEAPEEPRAKLGDIYKLGNHRLICGDSTDIAVIDRLMDGVKADMVFTDPPYGVDYKGINNDSRKGLSDLLNGAFESARSNTKQGGVVYCFHSDKCADIFQDCFRKFCHFSSMIIWKKSALVLSQTDYQSIHEPCLYGWFNNGTHNFYGDRKQTSVWEFGRENVDGHTTPKPIGFVAKALQNSSREDEIVLDVFGGSGSTLIACEQLNRKCYMCELDPRYIDVIIARWENLTGQKAELIKGGE